MEERSWEGAAHEYEEQARFARAERDIALARIAELEAELSLDGNARVAAYATERERKAVMAEREAIRHIARDAMKDHRCKPHCGFGNCECDGFEAAAATILNRIRARPAP